MKQQEEHISEFGGTDIRENTPIDFSTAKKIPTSGSICEAYIERHFRRKVFVKRLRPEFRNSSLHLAALDKEFDVGINLNHSGLPHYLEIHQDHIIMDFIDGVTLSDLFARKDECLNSKKYLWRFITDLLDIINYLHSKRVIHCDIKPDNILLTSSGNNVMLIDFDKCHTDWLDDSSGSTKLYFQEEKEISYQVDFMGLAFIIDLWIELFPNLASRNLHNFKKLLTSPSVDATALFDFINKKNNKFRIPVYTIVLVGIFIGLIFIGLVWWFNIKDSQYKETIETSLQTKVDTVVAIDQNSIKQIPSPSREKNDLIADAVTSQKEIPVTFNIDLTKDTDTPENSESVSASNPVIISGSDNLSFLDSICTQLLVPYITPFEKEIARMETLCKDPNVDIAILKKEISDFTSTFFRAGQDIKKEVMKQNPEISELEFEKIYYSNKVYKRLNGKWQDCVEDYLMLTDHKL